MAAETPTGDGFVEVVDERTSYVSRVPAEWLDDPRLGRFIKKTNAQLALDHELPAPPSDATKDDLFAYAASAGVDTEGLRTKADVLDALAPYLASSDSDEAPTSDADGSGDDPTAHPTTPAAGDNNPS